MKTKKIMLRLWILKNKIKRKTGRMKRKNREMVNLISKKEIMKKVKKMKRMMILLKMNRRRKRMKNKIQLMMKISLEQKG